MTDSGSPHKGRRKEDSGGRYWFLLVVAALYLLACFMAPWQTFHALWFSARMLIKILPVLGVVAGFMFLNNLLIKPEWVKNHVGVGSGFKGLVIAVAGGVFSMGPIYVWYEVLQDLHQKGMRKSLIASFLYARSVKPQLLPLMIHYFGWLYTILLTVYLILFSILNGWLTDVFLCRSDKKSA